jgi:hypothetical protein
MIVIKLKPSRKAIKEFDFINFSILEQCMNVLVNNLYKIDVNKNFTLSVGVSKEPAEIPWNHYKWGTNSIYMHSYKSFEQRYVLRRFMDSFIHEFRHWTQDKLLKVSFYKNYNGEGREYYKCPLEKDTRTYTKLLLNPTLKMYKNMLELKKKTTEFSKLNIKFNH